MTGKLVIFSLHDVIFRNSVTGRCILNMDHYCPWMNTCVGYGNYRYFVLFLLYLQIGCWYVVGFILGDFVDISAVDR